MIMAKDDEDDRVLVLNDVDEESSASIIRDLFVFAQKDRKKPIYIIVNSYGGSVYEMFALYDAIQYVKSLGITVYTMGIGKIMSSGVIVLVGGSVRKIGKNATVMWHSGTDHISGDLEHFDNEINEFKRLENLANEILSRHSKMTKLQIEKMISNRMQVYIDAKKAIEIGIADDYLDIPSDLGKIVSAKAIPPKRAKK